jgi:hypothetical protein
MEGPSPHPPAGMRLELWCSAPNTARVILYPSDDDIDVHMGEDTWIELLKRKRGKAERVQELRQILEAVVSGRYKETVWRVRGRTVKSKAVLWGSDGKSLLTPRQWHGLAAPVPDPRAKRTHIRYEPYS